MTLNPQTAVEIRETLSEQEETFETWRKRTGLVLGPLVAVSIYLMDMPSLTPKAHALAAILSWTVVWWICEPIPLAMSALFASVLCVVLGVADSKSVFAPYADPIIFLFLGCWPRQ